MIIDLTCAEVADGDPGPEVGEPTFSEAGRLARGGGDFSRALE